MPPPLTRFSDVVHLNTSHIADPLAAGVERYVGLEHITPEDLHIHSWGLVAEGTTFTNAFQPGQVLFGKRRAYQRKVAVADFSGVCSSDIYVFESKDPQVLLPELLPFICQTEGFYQHAVGTSAGSLSPRTNWAQLAAYEFPLPPLDEQRRIARLIWAMEEVVLEYQKVEEKLQGIFNSKVSAFIKELQQSNIPIVKLETLCSQPITNGIFRRREEFGKGMRLVNVTDIYSGFRVDETILDRVLVDQDEQERFSAKPGDVIFNRSSLVFEGVGHACLIPETTEPLLFECHLMRVRPDKRKILPEYLARLSLSRYGRLYIEAVAKKTTMTTINQKDLGSMPVLLPSMELQILISAQLDDIEQKIGDVKKHHNHQMRLKAQLLNRFLVG